MPYRAWLLLIVVVALGVSSIAPYDRTDWLLEHLPTAAALAFLIVYEQRVRPLRDVSYTLLFVFTLLHVVGAHHLYSRVPYVEWFANLGGERVASVFASNRNHYDRFVHLCFGLLVLAPIAELVERHVVRSRAWTLVVAVAFVAVLSKLYELAEWGIALAMSPEAAEAYNGQQGDPFDAQKDMALAFAGSLVSSSVVALRSRRGGGHQRG